MAEIKNWAQINADNVVYNVISYTGDGTYPIPEGEKLIQSDTAAIGYTYVEATETFINPNQG
jgi:hypothetical protein